MKKMEEHIQQAGSRSDTWQAEWESMVVEVGANLHSATYVWLCHWIVDFVPRVALRIHMIIKQLGVAHLPQKCLQQI